MTAAAAFVALGVYATSPGLSAAADPASAISARGDGYVIVDPDSGIPVGDSTFYPTGDLPDGTYVVIREADGRLPGGLSEKQLASLVRQERAGGAVQLSDGSVVVPPPDQASSLKSPVTTLSSAAYAASIGGWSSPYTGASIWGFDSTATVYYSFIAFLNTSQLNAGQGLGYYYGYNGSSMGLWSNWYSLGTASDISAGSALVPWGSVIAVAKFRAQCITTAICGGYFSPGP